MLLYFLPGVSAWSGERRSRERRGHAFNNADSYIFHSLEIFYPEYDHERDAFILFDTNCFRWFGEEFSPQCHKLSDFYA